MGLCYSEEIFTRSSTGVDLRYCVLIPGLWAATPLPRLDSRGDLEDSQNVTTSNGCPTRSQIPPTNLTELPSTDWWLGSANHVDKTFPHSSLIHEYGVAWLWAESRSRVYARRAMCSVPGANSNSMSVLWMSAWKGIVWQRYVQRILYSETCGLTAIAVVWHANFPWRSLHRKGSQAYTTLPTLRTAHFEL